MAVQGDDLWNSLLNSVEQDAGVGLDARAAEELKNREAGGVVSQVAGRVGDAANAALAGAYKSAFETKDFIFGEPTEENKWQFRKDVEQADRELRALSKWNGAISEVSQFVTGFIGAGKAMPFLKGGAGKAGYAVDAGRAALVGAVAMDPREERFSNFVQSFPALQNPVTNFLAAKPEDSKAEGRLKNAAESLLMDGVAATAFLAAAKVIKFTRAGDKVAAEAASKQLDDANVKLAQQEADYERKSFITEQDTAAAQQDLLNRSVMAQEPQGNLGKDFLGGGDVPNANSVPAPSGGTGADAPMGGRAAALDAEMRRGADEVPEVPGAGPTAIRAIPEGGLGSNASAIDAEFRAGIHGENDLPAKGGDNVTEAATGAGQRDGGADSVLEPASPARGGTEGPGPGQLPDGGSGGPSVGGSVPAPRAAAGPDGAIREGVEQVPGGGGIRREAPAKLISPEKVAQQVRKSATADEEAIRATGSVADALEDGHRFSGAGMIPYRVLSEGATPQFVRDFVENNAEQINKLRGGDPKTGILSDTRVNRQADQLAKVFEIDPQVFLGNLQRAGEQARISVATADAGMFLAKRAMLDLFENARRIQAGNYGEFGNKELALRGLQQQAGVAVDIYGHSKSIVSNAARVVRRSREEFASRALQMQKVSITNADPEALYKLLLATDGDTLAMAKAMTPNFVEQAVDWATTFRTANLLWGWSTQVVNTVSSAAMLAWRPFTAALGTLPQEVKAVLTNDEMLRNQARIVRQRSKVEAISTVSTIKDGIGAFKAAFKMGDSIMAPHASTEAFEHLTGGVGGQVMDVIPWRDFKSIDDVIANGIKALTFLQTADLRLMGAADEMVKTMRYRGVLMGRASVEADELGLKAGSKAYKDFLKAKADAGFDQAGRAIDVDALKEARITTFQQDLKLAEDDFWLGRNGLTLGANAANFVNNYPIAKMIVPFIKTPSNLFRYGVKLTPGLNLLQREYTNALKGVHGVEAQARAMGEMAMGIMLLSAGVSLRLNDRMTGSGPSDTKQAKEWRNQGNFAYAINFGDKNTRGDQYWQINRFDPIQMPVSLAADFVDMFMVSQNQGKHWVEGAAMGALLAIMHQLKDKTYYKGASDFLDSMDEPNKLKSWSERFAPGMVPGSALLRSINPDPYIREVNGMFDSIKATIPGFSDSVPARYDAFGEKVLAPGKFTTERNMTDPVNKALDEMMSNSGTYMTPATPNHNGVDIRDITLANGRNAYEYYTELSGKPPGFPPLKTALERLVKSKQYQALGHGPASTDNTKEHAFMSLVNQYREHALTTIRAEDKGFREALAAKATDAFNKAIAGKKNLQSVEARTNTKTVNDMLAAYGTGLRLPMTPTIPE